MGVESEIINKSGSWYSYEGNKIGQGRENLKEYLANNPNLMNEIEMKIREKFKKGDIESEVEGILVSSRSVDDVNDMEEIENAEF